MKKSIVAKAKRPKLKTKSKSVKDIPIVRDAVVDDDRVRCNEAMRDDVARRAYENVKKWKKYLGQLKLAKSHLMERKSKLKESFSEVQKEIDKILSTDPDSGIDEDPTFMDMKTVEATVMSMSLKIDVANGADAYRDIMLFIRRRMTRKEFVVFIEGFNNAARNDREFEEGDE